MCAKKFMGISDFSDGIEREKIKMCSFWESHSACTSKQYEEMFFKVYFNSHSVAHRDSHAAHHRSHDFA